MPCDIYMLCGISSRFQLLSPSERQVPHALLTRPPLSSESVVRKLRHQILVRLACVKHAASVHPEPGSNSHVKKFFPASFIWHCLLLIRVASQSFDRSACSWISLKILEFSGLHYCLFVKDQCFFRCCCSQRQLWYLITTAFVCQQLFSIFLNLFPTGKPSFSRWIFILPHCPVLCQQLFTFIFQSIYNGGKGVKKEISIT